MKLIKLCLITLMVTLGMTSCQSVRVATDYDKKVDFDQYKTFAFYKPGIDKAGISDLDKRRILRAIDSNLTAKGMTKSEDPDMLVSIFTKSSQNVNVYQNNYGYGYGWGWGFRPYYWGGSYNNSVSTSTEGTLYIDLIDASKKELIWQGMGEGVLEPRDMNEKIKRIHEIVKEILNRFPPGKMKK